MRERSSLVIDTWKWTSFCVAMLSQLSLRKFVAKSVKNYKKKFKYYLHEGIKAIFCVVEVM